MRKFVYIILPPILFCGVLLASVPHFGPKLANWLLVSSGNAEFLVHPVSKDRSPVPVQIYVKGMGIGWLDGPYLFVNMEIVEEKILLDDIVQPLGSWDRLVDGNGQNLYLERGGTFYLKGSTDAKSLVGVMALKTSENGILFDCVDRDFRINIKVSGIDEEGKLRTSAELANKSECNGYARKKINAILKDASIYIRPDDYLCVRNVSISKIEYLGNSEDQNLMINLYLRPNIFGECSHKE